MALLLKYNSTLYATIKNLASFYVSSNVSSVKSFATEVEATSSSLVDLEEEELKAIDKERLIERKRNVSRLNPEHRNTVNELVPYPEPKASLHLTVKYRRKMYGKYGSASGVNPGIMWPTKEDIKERKEYESVAYPFTIQEMTRAEFSKLEAQEAAMWARQKQIGDNLKNLKKWLHDLEARRAKKIKVVAEAKAKKDRLIEEVRRHFGYSVDPKEEKFQLMLEQKEKEDRKAVKMEKKKRRDEMIMQDLMTAAQSTESK